MAINHPLQKHYKARFPQLSEPRLDEMVSVDCFETNATGIGNKATLCCVFYGTVTGCIDNYKLYSGENGFLCTYQDFCRKQGVPSILKQDQAGNQKSKAVTNFNCEHLVKDVFSEAFHQHQNPVKSGAICWLKSSLKILLNMTGAPEWLWFHALQYLADVHNHTWNDEKQHIPATACDGRIKDISCFLQFYFFERVLYLDCNNRLPNALKSTERPGYMIRFAHNIGDNLTFKILVDQTRRIVNISVV